MSDERKAVLWSIGDDTEHLEHTDPNDAVAEWLDNLWEPRWEDPGVKRDIPATVEVVGWARRVPTVDEFTDRVIDPLLELIDEEYGDPEEYSEPTPGMRALERDFIDAVLKHYQVWSCEPVDKIEVDVQAWMRDNGWPE